MTLRTVVASILLSFASTAPTLAQAAVKHQIHIPQQSLGAALAELAKQTRIQVVYSTDLVDGRRAETLSGAMTPEEALNKLLSNTGLQFEFLDAQTVTLARESDQSITPASPPTTLERGLDSTTAEVAKGAQKPSFWDRFRLAQVVQRSVPAGSTDAQGDNEQPSKLTLEEIVVTAQKRIERLQDVPVPVTAINAELLVSSGQPRLQDYYTRVPGLIVTPDDYGTPAITIRGVTTGGFSNPTVGVVIDDVPYGSSTALGGGSSVPDIDPGDLARVEVLRGPQGTLYGASSIGGLLKFVTTDPSIDAISGRVRASTSAVSNGNGLGYDVGGSINVPLRDTLAVRASGFTRRDAGYVDDPGLRLDGVNEAEVNGGRLSALWRPSPTLSLKLNALIQDTTIQGSSLADVQPGLGDLQQQRVLRGYGGYDRHVQAYSGILETTLGQFDLTAASGYNINTYSDSADYVLQYGYVGDDHFRTNKFTQEIRLSTSISAKVEWLFGGFYTHEKTDLTTGFLAVDPSTGALGESLFVGSVPTTFAEYAAFSNVTFYVTDRFDVQIGGRGSKNEQSYSSESVGPLAGAAVANLNSDDSAFTWLVTPRLKVSPDLMIYARLASGYRPGGPNANVDFGAPPTFGPDKTSNYEIGVKAAIPDRSLSLDVSLFYIDWKRIQLQLFDPTIAVGYFANASRARSRGAEFAVDSKPIPGLTLNAWVAWNDATLTEGFPPASLALGTTGDKLPSSSRFSGSVSLEQELIVTNRVTAFAGGSFSYVGDRQGPFASVFAPSPERQRFSAYAKTDLRAGVRYDTWTVNLFVNNLADKRAVLNGGLGTNNPTSFQYIQPRTAGLSVSKVF
jgi:iron complex outermembrane recepter protein